MSFGRRSATAIHTVPTGIAALPPPGPATPVTATDTSAPLALSAPRAMAAAVSPLTTPYSSITLPGMESSRFFASTLYETIPPQNTSDEPGIAVIACAIMPPVNDSAVTRRSPSRLSRQNTAFTGSKYLRRSKKPRTLFIEGSIRSFNPDLVFQGIRACREKIDVVSGTDHLNRTFKRYAVCDA